MLEDTSQCVVCKKDANFTCSCRTVFYCSKKCQKNDWKSHKPHCEIPEIGGVCTRCEQEIKRGTRCLVPHPVACRIDMGSMYGPGSEEHSYSCSACNKNWTEKTPTTRHPATDTRPAWTEKHDTVIEGSKWCYQGHHSKNPIPESDNRVVRSSDVNLVKNPNLQQQLNSLPNTVRRLTVHANYDYSEEPYALEAHLPHLEVLVIDGFNFSKLILTAETTPQLRSLTLINLGTIDTCDFRVTTPTLENIEIQYMTTSSSAPINAMLAASSRLIKFYSYKLQVFEPLRFASTELKTLHIRRSDCLSTLSIYAPKLETLDLIACYDLNSLKILNTHRIASQLQPGTVPTRFTVNLENSLCSNRMMKYLQEHPRVHLLPLPDPDEYDF